MAIGSGANFGQLRVVTWGGQHYCWPQKIIHNRLVREVNLATLLIIFGTNRRAQLHSLLLTRVNPVKGIKVILQGYFTNK